MIENVPEPQEATRSEVVVGELGPVAPGFLAATSFAIHVVMQWISNLFATWSIVNEIVKSTNLKDNLLLSEGLSVEVIPLPHCFVPLPLDFVPPPYFFVLLPQTLLKHFDLESVFRATRDIATPPWALQQCRSHLSSHLSGVNYVI
jgi:hypothetical protein